ncbi:hypothetical protein VB796_18515 [Arcicella sp. LKC2W]|uniref:hypothetical protein n=1 Tax=Arcicella sp. LKC2W TaxID=2984198 RepID=UPI002B1ED25F|nr:hypothetical protein [Arcicella sp. LKC2W]MEA5461062.1 hypothetical protein [Arcicella sp. LKC2W]
MNKIYKLIFIIILFSNYTFGQIEKGKMLIGGSLDFASQEGGSITTFSPTFGYLFTDNIMGGVSLNTGDGNTQFTPFVRYYKPIKERIFGFGTVSYGFSSPGLFTIGAGINYFITDNVSLEPILSFSHFGTSESYGSNTSVSRSYNTISLGMGIQFFF